jgi:hypothetical protein
LRETEEDIEEDWHEFGERSSGKEVEAGLSIRDGQIV